MKVSKQWFSTVLFVTLSISIAGYMSIALTEAGFWKKIGNSVAIIAPALAEDEDEEEEENDDDEREPSSIANVQAKTSTTVTQYEVRKVKQTITVIPEAFRKDTDGDGLVDGIDPDPLVHQKEYFTDIDGDSVPNAFDQHHDEDDFAYFDNAADKNSNGVLDTYEGL